MLYAFAVALICLLAARRWLVIVTVRGRSMAPTLQPGDRVLVLRRGLGTVRRGRLVVLERPDGDRGWQGRTSASGPGLGGRHWWVKRVAAVAGDTVPAGIDANGGSRVPPGRLVVLGEGPGSGDSRMFGFVPVDRVLGSVLLRLPARGTGQPAAACRSRRAVMKERTPRTT